MSNPVTFSLSGGSGRSVRSMMMCPAKFKLSERWTWVKRPLPLAEGLILHNFTHRAIKGEIGIDDVNEIPDILNSGQHYDDFRDEWVMWDTEEPADKQNPDGETAVAKACRYIPNVLVAILEKRDEGVFGKDPEIEKTIGLEQLVNPVTGESDKTDRMLFEQGIKFRGRLDFLEGDHISDLKITKKEMTQHDVDGSEQGSWYCYFESMDSGREINEFRVHNFTKHMKGSRYTELRSKRTTFDFFESYNLMRQVGKDYLGYEADGYPKIGKCNGCLDAYYRKCEFFPLCFKNRFGSNEEWVKAMENVRKKSPAPSLSVV